MSRQPRKPSPLKQVIRDERKHWWSLVTRDLILFTVGLALLINEALIRHGAPRDSLLIIYAGMVGLPAALQFDRARRNGKDGDPK